MLIQNRFESFVLLSCSPMSKQFESEFCLFSKQFMPCVLAVFFAWNRSVKQQIKHHLYTLIYYYNMQLLGLRVVASIFGTFFALEVKILISI